MKTLLLSLFAFACRAPARPADASRAPSTLYLANIAESESPNGSKAYYLDAALATRHLLHKVGSDATHAAICGANAIPLGTIPDEGDAGDALQVKLLGLYPHTMLMVASEALATPGVDVFVAANGKIQDLPAGAGTYYKVGNLLTTAAADGDLVEVQHCAPQKVVVP